MGYRRWSLAPVGILPSQKAASRLCGRKNDIEDIRMQLSRFLQDPSTFEAMGECGLATLSREHSPRRYAEALGLIIPEVLENRRHSEALALADRVGERLGRFVIDFGLDYFSVKSADSISSFSAEPH